MLSLDLPVDWNPYDRSMTRTKTHTYSVPGMSCDHCVNAITDHLRSLDGVEQVSIDLKAKTVFVVGGDDATILAAIDEAGYDVE